MDAERTARIGNVLKSVATLGKNIKQPVAPAGAPGVAGAVPNIKKALTEATSRLPVASSGWIQIGFYILAGLLAIAIILLGVDQFITPIFQREPGGKGYIPIPGTDTTQVFWETYRDVKAIPVRSADPNVASASNLENRDRYAISMDIYINDEYPKDLPANQNRDFFVLGPSASAADRKFQVSIDNNKNTLYVKFFVGSERNEATLVIDHVPIRKPFRLGIVVNGLIGEAYLNGKLVKSMRLGSVPIVPLSGDSIQNPSDLNVGTSPVRNTADGIKVLNLQVYGYAPTPEELLARMNTLTRASSFI
jgi:hypothetical protein